MNDQQLTLMRSECNYCERYGAPHAINTLEESEMVRLVQLRLQSTPL